MSPAGYTEDALVERPAVDLLAGLGWETLNAYHEFDHGASTLGRETRAEVILTKRLRPALRRLNPDASPEAIDQAIEELTRDRSRMSLVAANREIYHLLKSGVGVPVPNPEGDGETVEVVHIIDWEEPTNNDLLFCSQFWVTGEMYTRRADLVGFVNGLPLVFIELKAAHRRLETAFADNLRDYKDTISQLFWPNALIILSNGSESRVGSVTAGWEHFAEWKKIDSEGETGQVSLETMLRGVCDPTRLLDLVENFTLFQEVRGGLIKLTAKNHQYLGVNNALEALTDIRQRKGKLGVFWHTQGSGKSVSMMFFAQKVLRKIPGNWTFVVVTDRQELDAQIYKSFASAGVVTEAHAQAESSMHLRRLLTEDHRYVFTLIHKFRTEQGEPHPVLSERSDIIVITDEAHRSQYDTLALNMRTALPNASFLAFTGTPLIVGEEKTRQVFGDYVSVYDFQQSVIDHATVPLYYENRIPELQLVNDNLNEDMERLLEEAELDEGQEKALEREFAREYHLITRDDRLESVAKDLVAHFTGRGFQGKAMVVSIDKATAIRMYDKVKRHWASKIAQLTAQLAVADDLTRQEIEQQIARMQETDMAVVVSQGQNEIADMAEKGLDIRPHRKRIVEEDLETKFKDPEDPFRLVFVCAMWMTGFDVPNCSTIYLDKPMRNHTLMQTIARANRVYPGKVSGLIVDYVGVFRNLEAALAIYGAGKGGDKPVEDKAALVAALRQSLAETRSLCQERGVSLTAIQSAQGFSRVGLLDDAVEALVTSEEVKRRYLDLANSVQRLLQAVLPDPSAQEFAAEVNPVEVIAYKIRALIPPADISEVMQDVEGLLDQSIAAEGYVVKASAADDYERFVDLSKIDFEKLAEQFKTGHKRTLNEKLKGAVAQKLVGMVRLNRTRMDYVERFQAMIDAYNAGSLNAEEFFHQLDAFNRELSEEERRGVSEQLSEEELAVFDLLTKPPIDMGAADRDKVKVTARKLLVTLKEAKLVLDWRKRQQSRAAVRVTIEKLLDQGLPKAYTPQLFEQKSSAVFQHVYEAYYGAGHSVYTTQ
ncbi:type I restriction endonuclease subunit R [Candidatus Cryosericum terrychapinii]|uniref:Type I restriction enzyme endonuclease subunit n=1 Tax=Candidatus Cryosericum terrychapinii TaxID=2290919 RepID=A0A398D3R1_9BACT|nr:type I restriction endonuclease subunit R [Candidatus Cryosericum terrychapinii]RIE05714.1 type I restriction endonuclease subunit R [Candidatus Cryosericum terrychapinii]